MQQICLLFFMVHMLRESTVSEIEKKWTEDKDFKASNDKVWNLNIALATWVPNEETLLSQIKKELKISRS